MHESHFAADDPTTGAMTTASIAIRAISIAAHIIAPASISMIRIQRQPPGLHPTPGNL